MGMRRIAEGGEAMRRVLVAAALAAALLAAPASLHAQGELRLGMTAADIPTSKGAPDQGGEGVRWMGFTIYDSLVYWNLTQEETFPVIVPALAEKYYPNPENDKEWIFELRRGVRFHDGSEFNADAVIWNLEKVFNDKSPQFDVQARTQLLPRLIGVKTWRKIDDYKVAIGSDKPDAFMLDEVVYLHISSPAQWQKLGGWAEFAAHPSGTGPFKVEEIVPRQRAVLVRNDDYWDKARIPKLDRLILIPAPDAGARVAGLLSGYLNFIEAPPPEAVEKLKAAGMSVKTNSYPHIWPYIYRTLGENTPFKDVRVRQALNLAINRDEIVTFLGGWAIPAKGLVVPDSPWFGNPSFKIGYDPERAKKLLAEAGYGPGNPLKLRFMISPSGSGQMQPLPMNELVQEQLKAVGVNLEFEVVEWNGLREQRAKGPLAASAQSVQALNNSMGTSTPFDAFTRLFSCDAVPPAGFNWAGVCDPTLQEMIVAAGKTFDPAAQLKIAQRIHERIVDQAYWLFVVHDANPRAMSPDVKGFKQAKSWTQDLTPIYIQK
jgi:peptide/nickel transport system substrate-binding protein